MPHNHDASCNDEAHDHDHEHDHGTPEGTGPRDNLFKHIDLPNVVALNATGLGKDVIKPWNLRLDESVSLVSDADDQLILRVPFTGSVKLRSVLLKTGPGGQTPTSVKLFTNTLSLDFNDVQEATPVQEFDIPEGRDVGEYVVKAARFTNISSIALFFPASADGDSTQIFYVGFIGEWSERKNNPVITVYEAQANLADHEKIQGTDGTFSSPQI